MKAGSSWKQLKQRKQKLLSIMFRLFFGRGLGDAKQKTTGNAEIDILEKMV